MTVSLDKIRNASIRQTSAGVEATRIAHLTEISGRPDARAQSALGAPGLPRYGDPHPSIPGLRLVDILLSALDVRQWQATLVYRVPSPDELVHAEAPGTVLNVEWFSANVTVDRLFDADGNRMFHWYAGNPESISVTGGNVKVIRSNTRQLGVKGERADVQIPSVGVRVLMTEATDVRPRRRFIGTTNSSYWSGDPPETWLFSGVAGRLEQGRWLNTYELIYRVDGWRLESVIEFNGAPPSDATEGNGITHFKVYESVNFGGLGFSV